MNWTLALTSALLLGAFFMVRSGEEFVEGFGYAFIFGACFLQLRYIVRSVIEYRKRQRQPAEG